ncbi:MAG: VOC family protein [Bdellovibrionales bacterium]
MNTPKFDFDSFKASGESFLKTLTTELVDTGIPAHSLECDHLCFRVGTSEEYNSYKAEFENYGKLLTEALVNGRAISTFLLNTPFQTNQHKVPLLELPAPKAGTNYETGFEHAEFVVSECFKKFSSKFPHLSFTEGGNQTLNPELCLKLSKGKQAKFHHHSLARVIELEEAVIKDIIFDFDGTLIKSRENIYEINRIVFSYALGREVSLQEAIEKFHPEFSKMFEAFAITCPIKQSEAISSWGTVSERFTYHLFDGVLETLKALKEENFRLHLWTARDEYSARRILKEHEIESFFTTLSFATEIDSKPLANSLNLNWKLIQKDKLIVIGDTPTDIIGAKNISAIRGAALWDSHSKKSSLIEAGAELFFHRVEDFRNWLNKVPKEVL